MLSTWIKSRDILGMNARNLNYIRPFNRKSAKRLADDKLGSKKRLKKVGLPVPELIAEIRSRQDLDNLDFSSLPKSFVLKPNFGFGGEGILIVYGKKKGFQDVWVKADRTPVTVDDIRNHVLNILDGSFSRTGSADVAFFEERTKLPKIFRAYSYRGMPDVRVIVHNNVPVMAMLRLATKESQGKANMKLGGIACGIDMATGTTTTAVIGHEYPRIIEYLPSNRRVPLSGIRIPYWDKILEMAVKAQKASKIGFLGADIALDRDRGPVFFELNARPGLAIQTANLDGMLGRLRRVSGLKVKTTKRGVTLAKNLFGGEIEEELEEISGKRIISTVERVNLFGKNDKSVEIEAKIDTGALSSSIDVELARELGLGDIYDKFQELDLSEYELKPEKEQFIKEDILKNHQKKISGLVGVAVIFSSSGSSIRPVARISFVMDQQKVFSKINIVNRKNLKYQMIVGRRDLKRFLVEV